MNRRRILLAAAGIGGATLLGCGGSGSSDVAALQPPAPPQLQIVWDPTPWMVFIAGSTTTVDLNATLPAEVKPGGTFSLATGSTPLPPGFALAANGRLTATNPQEGQTRNVLFMYVEPGA